MVRAPNTSWWICGVPEKFCAPPWKGLDIPSGEGDLKDQTVKQVNVNEA